MKEYPLQYASTDKNKKSHNNLGAGMYIFKVKESIYRSFV